MAVAASPGRNRRSHPPLRILTAVPLCDGHDSAIMTVNRELVSRGAEVVYLGYHQSATAIARAAVQEDVHVVGISSYNGGHVAFLRELIARLDERGGRDIRVVAGGGGTITAADARAMRRLGVDQVFFAGTPLDTIVAELLRYARKPERNTTLSGDRFLARAISLVEAGVKPPRPPRSAERRHPFVLGVSGPGGAGKSTLIDELTSRFLQTQRGRIAILANDPSHPGSNGALLGDRVAAIYAHDDRVCFRSVPTRGSLTGISAAAPEAIRLLRDSRSFDLIIIESVGIGQESDPFRSFEKGHGLVDATLFVTSPHYGGRIQLEKVALLHGADLVALNKCDDPRSATARAELTSALARTQRHAPLHLTTAAVHHDAGIDRLYDEIAARAGLEPRGGERACHLQVVA